MDPAQDGSRSAGPMPILRGRAHVVEEPNGAFGCRRCSKSFGMLTRSRTCTHCGFTYCTSCSDGTALLKREGSTNSGYDAVPICGFCLPNLQITSSDRATLKSLPVGELKAYLKAFGIAQPQNAVEKSDFIDVIMNARGGNGFLNEAYEDYYRKHVPNKAPRQRHRGLFSRMPESNPAANAGSGRTSAPPPSTPSSATNTRRTTPQSRSPPNSHRPQAAQPQPIPRTQPSRYNVPSDSPYSYRAPGASSATPPPSQRQSTARQTPAAGRPQTAPPPSTMPLSSPHPPPAIPTLDALLDMTIDDLHHLSVGTLKGILWENHVIVGQILEKDDLISKVRTLVDAERHERAREAEIRAAEEAAYLEQQRSMREEFERAEAERQREAQERERGNSPRPPSTASDHAGPETTQTSTSASPPKPPIFVPPVVERSGLCVICQDEEANIVVVDCGHLGMCRACSDLVMNTSKECPLCRTHIVTPQRLLRVYKS